MTYLLFFRRKKSKQKKADGPRHQAMCCPSELTMKEIEISEKEK